MKKSKRVNARQKAARRTAAGKFTKVVFAKIGGKDCPRFGPGQCRIRCGQFLRKRFSSDFGKCLRFHN